VAFDNIPCGPGIAYFPGLSLALKEVAYCNFGNRPFKHPQPGYRPIQVCFNFKIGYTVLRDVLIPDFLRCSL